MKPVVPLLQPSAADAPPLAGERASLQQSLKHFKQISRQLGDSHGLLQAHVAELQDRLELVSAQRLHELDEKERLAKRLQSLLDSLPGGVVVLDAQGIVREANPVARELLGEPLEGMLWRQIIRRCFAPRCDDGHEVSLKDGRRLSVSLRSLDGEPGQLILLTDMTETRRLQTQLARHERLSALGRMTASLAHQIRTPLTAAMLYASHLADQALPAEQQQRFAKRLKDRLHELEHQVRDMLVFARGDLPLADRLTPRELMQGLRSAAEPHLEQAPVRWQCDAHDGLLMCNRDTLIGALMNLIDNALQAATAPRLKIHLYRRDEWLHVCVSDNGKGIAPAVQQRLGEPFFTTRETGTGLGLTVVQAVTRAHRGLFGLRSRPGFGTCVQLRLPLVPGGLPTSLDHAQE